MGTHLVTYEQVLDRQPPTSAAGNKAAAAQFVVLLTSVIEGTGTAGFDEGQKNYLYRLRDKWRRRANGEDFRWNVTGSRPGRPPKDATKKRRSTRRDAGEDDPLFQSLMRKFGTPAGE